MALPPPAAPALPVREQHTDQSESPLLATSPEGGGAEVRRSVAVVTGGVGGLHSVPTRCPWRPRTFRTINPPRPPPPPRTLPTFPLPSFLPPLSPPPLSPAHRKLTHPLNHAPFQSTAQSNPVLLEPLLLPPPPFCASPNQNPSPFNPLLLQANSPSTPRLHPITAQSNPAPLTHAPHLHPPTPPPPAKMAAAGRR